MKTVRRILLMLALMQSLTLCSAVRDTEASRTPDGQTAVTDGTVEPEEASTSADRYERLTEEDYREVADSLGVEVAAIKAVVDIEAGKAHKGFWADGKPLINFDLTQFRRYAKRNGVNLGRYAKSHAVVFARPNIRKYGSQQAAQQARLDAARSIDDRSAIEGTFWGMFQIGGVSWKQCGADDIDDFVERMSRSERDQLDLFANFIRNCGMLDALRDKDWAKFARRYNGPSYRSRGYHTRMAAAYKKHKAAEAD